MGEVVVVEGGEEAAVGKPVLDKPTGFFGDFALGGLPEGFARLNTAAGDDVTAVWVGDEEYLAVMDDDAAGGEGVAEGWGVWGEVGGEL